MDIIYQNRSVLPTVKNTPAIYGWLNTVNGKWYVGQTKILRCRLRKYNRLNFTSQRIFYNAVTKYGIDKFICYKLMDCCPSIVALNYWEKWFIHEKNSMSPYGYNLRNGGDARDLSESTIRHMIASNKVKWTDELFCKKMLKRDTDRKMNTAMKKLLLHEYIEMRPLSSILQAKAMKDASLISNMDFLEKWRQLDPIIQKNYLLKYSITNPLKLSKYIKIAIKNGSLNGGYMIKYNPKSNNNTNLFVHYGRRG